MHVYIYIYTYSALKTLYFGLKSEKKFFPQYFEKKPGIFRKNGIYNFLPVIYP